MWEEKTYYYICAKDMDLLAFTLHVFTTAAVIKDHLHTNEDQAFEQKMSLIRVGEEIK